MYPYRNEEGNISWIILQGYLVKESSNLCYNLRYFILTKNGKLTEKDKKDDKKTNGIMRIDEYCNLQKPKPNEISFYDNDAKRRILLTQPK